MPVRLMTSRACTDLASQSLILCRLPSYANLPKAVTEPPVHLAHQLCLSSGPKWRVLLVRPLPLRSRLTRLLHTSHI